MTDRFKEGTGYPEGTAPDATTANVRRYWQKSDEEEKKILEEKWWTSWSLLWARFWLWLSEGV